MEKLHGKQLAIMATRARLLGLDAVHTAASGHIGGSLSAIDAITTLYFNVMNVDPKNPQDPDRDRFVLSKGHCTPALYPVLALRGFFPTEDLKLFRSIKGHYSGHAEMRHVKGVDMSTGSLGQGLSVAVGMMVQLALKARELLAAEGISVRVIDMHTIKPLDSELVIKAAKETGCIVTSEEHNIIGGLGSAVAECLSENCPTPLVRHGVNDEFGRSGTAAAVLEYYGLTAEVLCDKIREALKKK